jgi:hypothetical protein
MAVSAMAVVLAAAMAVGCGDDDSKDESGAATATTPTQKVAFTGEPITVYFNGPLESPVADLSDVAAAIRAGTRTLNAQGGLNGSEVKVKVCSDTDANAEAACVRRAIADKASAFVGSYFLYNPKASEAALEKAGIPNVAPLAAQQVEFSNSINFPIFTSSMGLLACPSQIRSATDAKRISTVGQDLPIQKELMGTIVALAKATKLAFGTSAAVPISQADYSGAVKRLAESKPDAVIDVLTPTAQLAFFTAQRSLGQKFAATCAVPANFTTPSLKKLGPDAGSVYLSSGLPPTSEAAAEKFPLLKEFREEMSAAADAGDEDASLDSLSTEGNALNSWLGVQLLEQAAKNVNGTVTGSKLLAALNKTKVDLSGADLPPIDFSKPVKAPGFERFFNDVVKLYRWDPSTEAMVPTDATPVHILELFAALKKPAS